MWINVRYTCLYGLISLIILCCIFVVIIYFWESLSSISWTRINWIYKALSLGNVGAKYKGLPTMAIYKPKQALTKELIWKLNMTILKGIRKHLLYLLHMDPFSVAILFSPNISRGTWTSCWFFSQIFRDPGTRASACAPRRNSHILWRSALSWSIFSSSKAGRFHTKTYVP